MGESLLGQYVTEIASKGVWALLIAVVAYKSFKMWKAKRGEKLKKKPIFDDNTIHRRKKSK